MGRSILSRLMLKDMKRAFWMAYPDNHHACDAAWCSGAWEKPVFSPPLNAILSSGSHRGLALMLGQTEALW
jgi:hypothetical protein